MVATLEIEIFKTNVTDNATAKGVLKALKYRFPTCFFNFDLDDCDHILRVENPQNNHEIIIKNVHKLGFMCQLID